MRARCARTLLPSPAPPIRLALQFFWWETGYLASIDIMHDRAGYYICWGCLVWVPVRLAAAALLACYFRIPRHRACARARADAHCTPMPTARSIPCAYVCVCVCVLFPPPSGWRCVQSVYVSHSYYMVKNAPALSPYLAALYFALGWLS
ncbi:hypothetical protein EON62_05075, partial [archaeon]